MRENRAFLVTPGSAPQEMREFRAFVIAAFPPRLETRENRALELVRGRPSAAFGTRLLSYIPRIVLRTVFGNRLPALVLQQPQAPASSAARSRG